MRKWENKNDQAYSYHFDKSELLVITIINNYVKQNFRISINGHMVW